MMAGWKNPSRQVARLMVIQSHLILGAVPVPALPTGVVMYGSARQYRSTPDQLGPVVCDARCPSLLSCASVRSKCERDPQCVRRHHNKELCPLDDGCILPFYQHTFY
ncbi:hypothetical protein NDU88_004633 [Pleurodeles waltl]|uniref:Uncharacterized protein n=1 Tax=Pleurodeles waltl TaxID=8319 RepID=A0AAV7WWG7_PLEWA|nr:hypothetical protein NDU88_004633 [Pleurodeles waltl]